MAKRNGNKQKRQTKDEYYMPTSEEDELDNWIVGETEDGHMPLVKKKKKQTEEEMYMPTSEEEFQADLAADDMRYHHYCLEQQEMYDDPYLNWSGLR
jgi:hypothetical protein